MSSKMLSTDSSVVSSDETQDKPQEEVVAEEEVEDVSEGVLQHILFKICGDNDSEVGNDCSICMEAMVVYESVVRLVCGHYYHEQCVSQWLCDNITCPQCRHIVADNPFYTTQHLDYDEDNDVSLELIQLVSADEDVSTTVSVEPRIVETPDGLGVALWAEELIDNIIEFDETIRLFLVDSDDDWDDEDNDHIVGDVDTDWSDEFDWPED